MQSLRVPTKQVVALEVVSDYCASEYLLHKQMEHGTWWQVHTYQNSAAPGWLKACTCMICSQERLSSIKALERRHTLRIRTCFVCKGARFEVATTCDPSAIVCDLFSFASCEQHHDCCRGCEEAQSTGAGSRICSR